MNSTGKTVTLFGTEYQVADEHDGLITIQELKSFLPEMEDELYEQLKDDISLHGIHDPILYKEFPEVGKLVLEGHTRLKVAIEVGYKGEKKLPRNPVQEDFQTLDEIKLWMIKHQMQRRNLNAAQKLRIAMPYKEVFEKEGKKNQSVAGKGKKVNKTIDTAQEIAKQTGVSRESVKRYMRVFEKGSPELLDELDRGTTSIYNAFYKTINYAKSKSIEFSPTLLNDFPMNGDIIDNDKIKAIIIVKDEKVIDSFLPAQRNKFAFYIHKE